MLTILGIVIFFVGILVSVAWHELGHLVTAKWFGIKVSEYFVGFGRTLWSRKRGETEYGIKLIPLGGYIRMIGMIPPARGTGELGTSRRTGPFQGLIDDVRHQSAMEVRPEDVDRQFWTRTPWKRVVVMFAGPFMNLVLAVVLFGIQLMWIGVPTTSTTLGEVNACVLPASAPPTQQCPAGAPLTPAAAAGMLPGDRIVAFNGAELGPNDGQALQKDIRAASGPVTITVERAGVRRDLPVSVISNQVESFDEPGALVQAGFLGVGLRSAGYVRQSVGAVFDQIGDLVARTGHAIAQLPQRVPSLFGSVFFGEKRDVNGPVGVVGVSRIGGEVLSADYPPVAELSIFLNLLAAVNISLFLFNLLPIPPLDGGQIFPALWESARRRIARVRDRPDPGPVDVAKLMPVAYVVAMVFIAYSGLLVVADIINPITLTQ